MKKTVVFILFFVLFSVPVSADGVYDRQYEKSGAESIKSALDDETADFLEENGIDPKSKDFASSLTAENVFSHIGNFLKSGAQKPLASGGIIIGIILISAAVSSFENQEKLSSAAGITCTLAVGCAVSGPIWSTVSAASAAVSGSSTFMLSFVPIFASLIALSGAGATAAASSSVLLLSAELVSSVASFAVMPIMGCYLAVSLCGFLSGAGADSLASVIKKFSLWTLSLVTTVFLGVLSIQTSISTAADSVTLKTAKFIVGTSVPVAGSVLSEAASAVSASVGLLRSSVGIYGVVALCVIFLPIILELFLWRAVLTVCAAVGDALSVGEISKLLRATDGMISVLLGITALVATMFIISLAVVISVVRT